jgi:hypothetical protein
VLRMQLHADLESRHPDYVIGSTNC